MADMGYTIKFIKEGLEKGEFSIEEIRREYLRRIEKENPKLNAYLSVFSNQGDANMQIYANDADILAGVPCAIKDNILIAGEKCTAGSKILKNYIASYDATVVSKLKKAGAVFLGKTNLDEFAMGSTGENSAFGPTLNPHDHKRVAGGSSSGSGAAVAADLAVFALGSDTGGSIRAPASFCGVVGLKPTYGLVSRYGLIAMASSFDQIGPITKNVEDAAIVLNVIAGRDSLDSTSVPRNAPDYTANLGKPIEGLKVGVPKEFLGEGLDSRVNNLVQKALSELESLGAHIDEISLPMTDYALAAYYIIVPAEVSANLARYDGIKYGYSAQDKAESLLDVYLNSRAEGFGDEVKRRIMLGTYTLSAGYYDAYYIRAQKVRALIRQDFERIFEKYDVVVGPTMSSVAPRIGELSDPLSLYMADMYTVQVNIAGLPAISVPCGFVEVDGAKLPAGLQIIGNYFDEAKILQIAYAIEKLNIKYQILK
jgi:aspartyl-tRNA(Asn)/glutamyl-tRNA(Gln) amidotransferase subunit A